LRTFSLAKLAQQEASIDLILENQAEILAQQSNQNPKELYQKMIEKRDQKVAQQTKLNP